MDPQGRDDQPGGRDRYTRGIMPCRLREASLRALKYVVQSELLVRIVYPVFMGIFIIFFFLRLNDGLKAQHAMLSNFAAALLTCVVGSVLLHVLLPKPVLRSLFQVHIVSDKEGEQLLLMLESRNQTSHIYKEEFADILSANVQEYYDLMLSVLDRIKEQMANRNNPVGSSKQA